MMGIPRRMIHPGLMALTLACAGVSYAAAPAPPSASADASIPAHSLDDAALSQFRELGWRIERGEDGSVLLYPPADPLDKTLAVEPAGPARNNFHFINEETLQELKSHGWEVDVEPDGSVLLYPPEPAPNDPAAEPAAEPAELATLNSPAAAPAATETAGQSAPAATPQPFDGAAPLSESAMFDALEERGWMVEKASDGSLLLYPPGHTAEPESASASAAPLTGGCAGVIPSAIEAGAVELPVDTWDEAHQVAMSWLEHNGGDNLTVGRIRHIYRVHLVSIVDAGPPHALQHQIAIRRSDGSVILLE